MTRARNPATCYLVVDYVPPAEPEKPVTACGLRWHELRPGHHLTPFAGEVNCLGCLPHVLR